MTKLAPLSRAGLPHPSDRTPDGRWLRPTAPAVLVVAPRQPGVHRMRRVLGSDGIAAAGYCGSAADVASNGGGAARVVIVACDLADASALAALRRLRKHRRTGRLVAVTPVVPGSDVRRALEAGVDGVVFENDLEHALGIAVRAVLARQVTVPRALRGTLHPPALSFRQKQVVSLAAQGLTNAEIAERLFLTESTVKTHLSAAFEKLAVRSRSEAAALLLDPEQGVSTTLVPPSLPDAMEPGR